jgi:hypothetical protein
MLNTMNRLILFLVGCIGVRALFAYYAKIADPETLRMLGYIALLPAIGFFVIYFGGLRKTGLETGGQAIWWNDLRPVHGLLYSFFAFNAIEKNPSSWMYLFADVVLGLTSFLAHHLNKGDLLTI